MARLLDQLMKLRAVGPQHINWRALLRRQVGCNPDGERQFLLLLIGRNRSTIKAPGARMRKNWLLAELSSSARAMEATPWQCSALAET